MFAAQSYKLLCAEHFLSSVQCKGLVLQLQINFCNPWCLACLELHIQQLYHVNWEIKRLWEAWQESSKSNLFNYRSTPTGIKESETASVN